jgi:hypothetical protein
MTTPASAIPQVIDALVAIATAAFPDATSLVDVNDGPAFTQEDTGQTLWIGSNGDDASNEAATADQIFPYTNTQFRRDTITVHCVALAWNGDDDFKTVRDQAFAQMQAFTAAVVADNTLSGAVNIGTWSAGSNVSLAQGFNNLGGVEARVSFSINATVQFQG